VEKPKKMPGARLCLAVTSKGVTAYCNPAALKSLAKWLEWISLHAPEEHFECHVGMDIEDDESKFDGRIPSNVWVLIEKSLSHSLQRDAISEIDGEQVKICGFNLTFMATPEDELDEMALSQIDGILR
jgi:hypothetical protein